MEREPREESTEHGSKLEHGGTRAVPDQFTRTESQGHIAALLEGNRSARP